MSQMNAEQVSLVDGGRSLHPGLENVGYNSGSGPAYFATVSLLVKAAPLTGPRPTSTNETTPAAIFSAAVGEHLDVANSPFSHA